MQLWNIAVEGTVAKGGTILIGNTRSLNWRGIRSYIFIMLEIRCRDWKNLERILER